MIEGGELPQKEKAGEDITSAAFFLTAESIYAMSWQSILADQANASRTVATGYSCRCQAAIMDGLELAHPLQLLLSRLKADPTATPKPAQQVVDHHEEY